MSSSLIRGVARPLRTAHTRLAGKGQLAWYIGSDDCDASKIPQLPGFEGSLDIKEGDPDTLRTFTFEGDSACFASSTTFGILGLGSLSMTYTAEPCPCE